LVDVAANRPPTTVAFAARPPQSRWSGVASIAAQTEVSEPRSGANRIVLSSGCPALCSSERAEPGSVNSISPTRVTPRCASSIWRTRVGRFKLLSVARELPSLPAPEPPGAAAVIGDVGDF